MPLETKKYQTSLYFFNKIINSNILDMIDFTNKEEQIIIKPEDEEFNWAIKKGKTEENGYYEIKVEYNNISYLNTNKSKMTIKEMNKRKITYNCFLYDINKRFDNSSHLPSKELLKKKYGKEKIEFIYNDFWFKNFEVKNCIFFIKL